MYAIAADNNHCRQCMARSMKLQDVLESVGQEVHDPEEESLDLFCEGLPSGNLGFLDSRASEVDVTIADRDFTIKQSPTILSSSRAGGTTGAVLWKITPVVAEWLANKSNFLWTHGLLLQSESTIAELGCGISGLIPLVLAPLVRSYIATDQEYVHKLLKENLEANYPSNLRGKPAGARIKKAKSKAKTKSAAGQNSLHDKTGNIAFTPLDWERDSPSHLKLVLKASNEAGDDEDDGNEDEVDHGFDLLVACDTIYNEALIPSFVQTCADICRLRPAYGSSSSGSGSDSESTRMPTLCIVAQHLRSSDVFERWCRESLREFHVWRVTDEETDGTLGVGSGYSVHLLLLRSKEE